MKPTRLSHISGTIHFTWTTKQEPGTTVESNSTDSTTSPDHAPWYDHLIGAALWEEQDALVEWTSSWKLKVCVFYKNVYQIKSYLSILSQLPSILHHYQSLSIHGLQKRLWNSWIEKNGILRVSPLWRHRKCFNLAVFFSWAVPPVPSKLRLQPSQLHHKDLVQQHWVLQPWSSTLSPAMRILLRILTTKSQFSKKKIMENNGGAAPASSLSLSLHALPGTFNIRMLKPPRNQLPVEQSWKKGWIGRNINFPKKFIWTLFPLRYINLLHGTCLVPMFLGILEVLMQWIANPVPGQNLSKNQPLGTSCVLHVYFPSNHLSESILYFILGYSS